MQIEQFNMKISSINKFNSYLVILMTLLLSINLTNAQVTLPSMVTIPPDAPVASSSNNFSMYVMTIYDQACVDQTQMTDANSTDPTNSDDDPTLSSWIQSQYVIYIGAVALNNNNTCQVVCQLQTLKQFAIMFGSDIRTRSVLVGRVYMTTMPDNTSCSESGSAGTCTTGICNLSGNSTVPESSTITVETTTIVPNENSTQTTNSTTNESTTLAPSSAETSTQASTSVSPA